MDWVDIRSGVWVREGTYGLKISFPFFAHNDLLLDLPVDQSGLMKNTDCRHLGSPPRNL
jgi:hypothetical protein